MSHTSIYFVYAALKKIVILENLVATLLFAPVSLNSLQKAKISYCYESYIGSPERDKCIIRKSLSCKGIQKPIPGSMFSNLTYYNLLDGNMLYLC